MTDSSSPSPEPGGGAGPSPDRVVRPGRLSGRLAVPPSKSITHRFVNLALLARRPVTIERPLVAEDTGLFLAALEGAGFGVERGDGRVRLVPPTGGLRGGRFFCGNAGTMYRFVVASLSALPGRWEVDGVARLRERPVGPLVEALRALGARIDDLGREGYAPLAVTGGTLAGGRARLEAGESSQYLSALLMASLAAGGPVEIEVASLVSAPYVELTVAAVEAFGGAVERTPRGWRVEPAELTGGRRRVEGDWSAAAYPAAGAALTGGRVRLEGVRRESRQGDRSFLAVLERMGARVRWQGEAVEVSGSGELTGIDADFSDIPDQVPTFAALAPFARGVTRVRNVAHLRIKESDRLAAMASELGRLGAEVEELEDGLVIGGVWADAPPPEGRVRVDPHGDHRIAMSLALAGLRRPGVVIGDPGVVDKSYPAFWDDFEALHVVG